MQPEIGVIMNTRLTVKLIIFLVICAGATRILYAGQENKQSPQIKVLFGCPTSTIKEFKIFAQKAAELGATHVYISDLPKSRWLWEMDLSDPYPNWGMGNATIFKIIIPPELEPYLPAEYAKKNLEIIKKRCAILKKLGLKAAFSGKEPAYLPEAVYQDHPQWRGPRCEHPRRARNTYYAPCIDQPKILEMYRKAIAELCRHAPVELFSFLTNDSGGGICWSVSLYPGQNGPAWCESRSYAKRVVGFLSTIQQGAKAAGLEAEVSFRYGSGYISRTEVESVIPYLKPGQTLNGKNREGFTPAMSIGYGDYFSGVGPVVGIPQVMRVAEQLQYINQKNNVNLNFNFLSLQDASVLFELIYQFNQNSVSNMVQRMQAVRRLAVLQVGDENADQMMEVWEKIYKAVHEVISIGPDPIMLVGSVNQRWITRPLVPFPLELTAKEKDYYRKFQFQANSEEEAVDLMNLQGFEMINGYSGSLLATWAFNNAIQNIQAAIQDVEQIKKQLIDGDKISKMEMLGLYLQTLNCFYRNAKHTIQYQDILDRTDYENSPIEDNIYPMDGDQLLREIQIVTRNEIDNTNELISLLESNKITLVKTAPSVEEEDIFILGPNIIEQLKKKVNTMLKHQLEVHRLYKRRQG